MQLDNESLLRRRDAASALTEAGYPIEASTLATMASRGGGPRFKRFGRIPLYRWADLLEWAEEKSSPFASTATECEARRGKTAA